MSKTPLCRSTAYLSGVKDEVNELNRQLSYLKDDISSLQDIKTKLLLIQRNQREDNKLIEHNFKSNEINQTLMKTELSSEINDLKESLNDGKKMWETTYTALLSRLEAQFESIKHECSEFEEKIISKQNSLKSNVEIHWTEFLKQLDDSKEFSQNIFHSLLKFIINTKNEIDERQKKQEDLIFKKITNLEAEILKINESTRKKFHQQEEEIKNNNTKFTQQIMNLKTQTNTDLEKNDKDLRQLIEEKCIDIKAEQKMQKESVKNYYDSFHETFSKKQDNLQKDVNNKLLIVENIHENQETLSQKNIHLEDKLENTFQKYDDKLNTKVSMLVKLFNEKYGTLKDYQKAYERTFTSLCNSLIEVQILRVEENQGNNFKEVITNAENQKSIFDEQISSVNADLKKIQNENEFCLKLLDTNNFKEEFKMLSKENKMIKDEKQFIIKLLEDQISTINSSLVKIEEKIYNCQQQYESLRE
ncbi:synaptonemal complex protein 1-like [Leptopilina heterotoma]|uniref:synaptonemal complex protein 1-like n=1 Tax=Leptopilina heterotoma TaxID=63436 RepID=UPI001CA9130B|nr:synaptonemal complex protein 1-like [Leptopilina heterotoma]